MAKRIYKAELVLTDEEQAELEPATAGWFAR